MPNISTTLELSPLAEKAYYAADPLKITEDKDGTFSISGFEDRNGMTATEVNSWLEDLAADCGIEITYSVKPEFWDVWFSEETDDHTVTDSEVDQLSIEWNKPKAELLEQLIEINN